MNSPPVYMGQKKRLNTRNIILDIIRKRGEASKYDVKRISGFSMSTVLSVIGELEADGYIIISRVGEKSVGRTPTFYKLNPDKCRFIGIEFNADDIYGVVLDFELNMKESEYVNVKSEYADSGELINLIIGAIEKLIIKIGGREKIYGVGIGAPGYVNSEGISSFYAHIPGWRDIPLKKIIEERFRIDVFVDNNINFTAVAHKCIEENNNYLLLSVRRGVRFGCIINNELYRGANNMAGEIAHIAFAQGTRVCPCGKKGCLESEVANQAVIDKITEGVKSGKFSDLWEIAGYKHENIDVNLFAESVILGHKDSLELFDEICSHLGIAISWAINMYNPSIIYIRSQLNRVGQIMLDKIYDTVRSRSLAESVSAVRLKFSDGEIFAGAVGAAAYAAEREFSFVKLY